MAESEEELKSFLMKVKEENKKAVLELSIQKLFCGIYSAFKCSFDEFVGEKVFSPSYSSSILAPLLAILILACVSSSPAFLMMYSAYKLNKQGDNIQP